MEALSNELIQSLGYVGVFLLMLFFASELVMPLAGFLAIGTGLWLPGVVLAGALGSTLGSTVIYYGARFVSPDVIHRLAAKYGRFIGISAASTKRAERWFDRHARGSVLLGKFAPGVRSATSFVAGYRHMHFGWFLACTALATLVSAGLLALAGYFISDNFDDFQRYLGEFNSVVRIVIVLSLVGFFVYRRKRYGKQLDKHKI